MNRTTSTAEQNAVLDAALTLSLDLQGVKLIEASAGTGKTYTIANLYVRYVLAGKQVNQILVVTFTNAATEELRGRIRARLHTCQLLLDHLFAPPADSSEVPGAAQIAMRMESSIATENDVFLQHLLRQWHACLQADSAQGVQTLLQARTQLKLAVRSMDEAAIFTIHGFCQRALNDHAFYSGQAFQLDIASSDDQLWVDALKDWWRRESYELSAQQEVLFFSALRGLDDVLSRQKMLRETRNRKVLPDITISLQEFYQSWQSALKPVSRLAKIWQTRHEELKHILLTSSAISRTAKNGYKLEELPERFALWDEIFSANAFDGDPRQLQMLSAAHLQENSKPKQKGTDPDLFDPFFTDCESVLQVTDQIRSAFAIRALVEASDFARGQVEQIKQHSRTLSYNDLLTRLYDALKGAQGPVLAKHLRVAFPVAMIDEFQDTDAIQYGIFRSIYLSSASTDDCSLIMIGDPKQAIYSFRGGDIFTYINARHDAAGNLFTLATNWRSVPSLVHAANSLFGNRADPFIYSDAIVFAPVNAAANPQPAYLNQNNEPLPALTIWQLPHADDGRPLGKRAMEKLLHESTAAEIHRLLEQSQRGEITLGKATLQAGHIAVLVRDSRQGVGVRQALLQRGINAVTVGRDKVFTSAEAHGLLKLLSAVLQCSDRKRLRQALTSELLDYSYSDMAAVVEDEANWLRWCDDFKALNILWQQKGFMAMFQVMLQKLELGQRLAAMELAERSLTNTLHLAELLQQRARVHPGQDALLDWFEQQVNEADEEETELRLESDEALVKIVTIHASKGLEYPVVFVPYLWSCRPCEDNRGSVLSFHDSEGNAVLDLGSDQREAHLIHAERERLAEDMRLLYVAVTRARSKVYLAWGTAEWHARVEKSALAWLLIPQQSAASLQTDLPQAFSKEDDLAAPLQKLVTRSAGNIELIPLPEKHLSGRLTDDQQTTPILQAQEFIGHIANDWRITSFSALTRDVHQATHSGSPRNAEDPILSFPAGSHVGLFLHSVLEELDFQQPLPAQLEVLHDKHAARHGLDSVRTRKPVFDWIECILRTPLQEGGFCLAQLSTLQRLNELAFDFSVRKADITRLNNVLEKNAHEPFAQSLPRLNAADFRGLVTGIIDLVFVHEGRYYIADYKSNYLGGSLQDYTPDKLLRAMLERRYDLQYLLYAVALQRFLRHRLPDYSHSRHFGGVYYLFLRGMRPQLGASSGVFFARPDEQLLNELDQLVFATPSAEKGEPA